MNIKSWIDIPVIFYIEKYNNYVIDKCFACHYFDIYLKTYAVRVQQ